MNVHAGDTGNTGTAYILVKDTRSRRRRIIMDPKLAAATHLVALLTYVFIRFDVVRMGEWAEGVKASARRRIIYKSRTHNN